MDAEFFQGDKKLGQAHAVTNPQGKAILGFVLHGSGEGLRINTAIRYERKEENLSFTVPCKKGSPVQFGIFPEGGNLVSGIPDKLAFKAVNIDGNPINVKGILFEDDKPMLEFKSIHAGMGSFSFTPETEKNYYIRLTEPATDSIFVLPEILKEGTTMRLTGRNKDYLEFTVSQSPDMPKGTVYLRGQMRGKVYCMAGGKLNRELKIRIPLKEFPQQGIAEFTLFNENLIPVAERLTYLHPDRKLYIEVQPDKEKYETREKATLKIKVTDDNGQPIQANLGISVFDKLFHNPREPKNILAHCYLSEQLRGRIYDPAYYFDEKNKGREEALDLLLVTQGWRKYVWDEENLKTYSEITRPAVSDGTAGEVHFTKKLKQAPKGEQFVMAFYPGENGNSDFIVTDSIGRFMVTPVHLKTWQGGYVYLKPMGPTDFEPRISLSYPFKQITETMKIREISYPLPNNTDTVTGEPARPFVVGPNVIELNEVTIKGKSIKPFRDKFMGHLDSIAKLNLNYVWACCHDYLENYKEGYSHECDNCGDTIRRKPVEGKRYTIIRYEYVGRSDGRKIVTDVQHDLEYHYPKYTEEELLKMNNLYRIKAYYGKREFYQPNYDKESESDVLPDTRNTLLWAPMVITDEKGEATLEFFCSDVNTGFVGNIEGVSADGLLGNGDFEFKVRKTKPFKWEK